MAEVPEVQPAEAVVAWTDLAAAARYKAVHSRVWLGLILLCGAITVLVVIAPNAILRVMAAFLVVYIGTCPIWGPTMATWMQARRRSWPGTPTSWQPTAEGMTITSAAGQATLAWSSLSRVRSWRRGVSITRGRGVVFVPARAFSGEEHRRSFVAATESSVSG